MGVRGIADLKKSLRNIRAGNQNAIRTASFAGARHLRDAERRAAPRATGKGVRAIFAKRRRGRPNEGIATVEVGPRAFYLRILEVGAVAHVITPRKRRGTRGRLRALAIGKGRGWASPGVGVLSGFRRSVSHPGLSPRPWFSPTYDRERTAIAAVVGKAYEQALIKQVEKRGLG